MNIPSLKLADGHQIPQIGLGTWKVKDEAEFDTSFEAALQASYRHIDTAQAYGNEQFLGRAWRQSGRKREELFITTKIAVTNFGHKKVRHTFAESLEHLQTDYVDLLLLHFPVTLLRKKAWTALEEIQAAGQAKSIGVSNYTIRHLEEMHEYAKVMPAVNQVELHVFLQQPELIKYCHEHDIVVEAYSPLAHAKAMDNQVIADIAKKHGKTYAQIMLRWCVQQGLVVLPKSVTPKRVQENIAIFDFELDDADMQALAKQDQDMRTCWSPVHVP
ncbi:MAG TPA: aldo/keto reductase [Candidatus Saccharimonadales bacterium]|nr:aldo/keto reductase [Candidatus Saccharimonadales bacterium]